jgi:hypothetical protein
MLRTTERTKKECYQLCHLTYFFPLLNKDTVSMDLANFLLRHWGSRYVLVSNCVYYLIPVGHNAFVFPCDSLFVAVIMRVLQSGMKVE